MAEDVFGIVGTLQAGVFRVDEVVAEGGFAVVYRAHHQGFRADVALKCLKVPGNLSSQRQETFLSHFREEGELLFRLSTLIAPVVRPLHVGVLESPRAAFAPFIALEWLDGESLDTLIARRRGSGKPPLDLRRVVLVLGPVARALERAHAFPGQHGPVSVLHRDLKPENLFIAEVHGQKVTKILDFGLAKVKSHATQSVGRVSTTTDGLAAFTPAYGAPEQWLPKRFGQTGPWTDVFGLALTFVEAVTGQAPLEGDAHALLGACVDETRRPTPRTLGCDVPDAVEAALAKALAVDPRDRYHDIGLFWDRIEGAVGVRTPRFGAAQTSLESILPLAPRTPSGVPDLVIEPTVGRAGRATPALPSELPLAGNYVPAADTRAEAAAPRSGRGASGPLELDANPRSASARARLNRPPNGAASLSPERATRDLVSRLRTPGRLIAFGVALMAADLIYTAISGATVRLGPVRTLWIAGPLVVLGFGWLLVALLATSERSSQ